MTGLCFAKRMGANETYERSKQTVTLYAEWPLRIVFASVFLFHGISKFTNGIAAEAEATGFSTGLMALAAISEIVAGAFVFIGGFTFPYHSWFTRIGAVAGIPVVVAAIALYHWPHWHFAPTEEFPLGGMMFQVTLILTALYFLASAGRIREHFEPTNMPADADGDTRVRVWANNMPIGAHWFLRIAFASVFLYMGFNKFSTLDEFAAMMDLGVAVAFLVAFFEAAAGILILVGGGRHEFADNASRLAGLLVFPVLIGAIWRVHAGRWDFGATEAFPMGGAEFQTLLLMVGLFFVLRGRPSVGPVAHTTRAGA